MTALQLYQVHLAITFCISIFFFLVTQSFLGMGICFYMALNLFTMFFYFVLLLYGLFCILTSNYELAVLDFTLELVKTGLENISVLALVVFSLQYVLVNHEYWKYKVKHVRWKITLKACLSVLFICCYNFLLFSNMLSFEPT